MLYLSGLLASFRPYTARITADIIGIIKSTGGIHMYNKRIKPAPRRNPHIINTFDQLALGQRIYHQPTLHEIYKARGYATEAKLLRNRYLLWHLALAGLFFFGLLVCAYSAG